MHAAAGSCGMTVPHMCSTGAWIGTYMDPTTSEGHIPALCTGHFYVNYELLLLLGVHGPFPDVLIYVAVHYIYPRF